LRGVKSEEGGVARKPVKAGGAKTLCRQDAD